MILPVVGLSELGQDWKNVEKNLQMFCQSQHRNSFNYEQLFALCFSVLQIAAVGSLRVC